jgi:hypothetical protein
MKIKICVNLKSTFIAVSLNTKRTILYYVTWGRGVRSKVLRPTHFQGERSEGRISHEAIKADRKWEGVMSAPSRAGVGNG